MSILVFVALCSVDSPRFRQGLCDLGALLVGPLDGLFRLLFQLLALLAVQQQVGNQRAFLDLDGISLDLSARRARPSVYRLILVVGIAMGQGFSRVSAIDPLTILTLAYASPFQIVPLLGNGFWLKRPPGAIAFSDIVAARLRHSLQPTSWRQPRKCFDV